MQSMAWKSPRLQKRGMVRVEELATGFPRSALIGTGAVGHPWLGMGVPDRRRLPLSACGR
jgi:hypothetical protein